MTEDLRILELRRRVQEDPASIVFAELAEEARRAGNSDEAVNICRSGLIYHPNHLGARVTLGRALVELNKLDDAFTELTSVLDAAPGDLVAIRALAEIYQRRGMMSEALVHYRRALQLAQQDAEVARAVEAIEQAVKAPERLEPAAAAPKLIEDLFDFDSLLAQLDTPSTAVPLPAFLPLKLPAASPLDAALPPGDDAFAVMEQQLREREEQRLVEERRARQAEADRRRAAVIEELEGWLSAIVRDRDHSTTQSPRCGDPGDPQPSA